VTVADDATDEDDDAYQSCLTNSRVCLIYPTTGKVLGGQEEQIRGRCGFGRAFY
jgi:hypothetical protein